MHRAKPISIRVRAPSRGLVSRLPGETADQMTPQGGIVPGSLRRAAARSSNVRFEDGVAAAAPGYQVVGLTVDALSGFVAFWTMDEVSGDRLDSSGNGRTLTAVDGEDGSFHTLIVGSEPGVAGLAATFPAV